MADAQTQAFGRIAVYQGVSQRGNVAGNLTKIDSVARQAKTQDAHTVVFPELFLCGYDIGAEKLKQLAMTKETVTQRVGALARDNVVNLVVPYAERDGDKIYNAAAVLTADGTLLFNYRKCHLWSAYEKDVFTPGGVEDLRPFVLPPHNVVCGVLICFDVEFPEPARVLGVQGVQLLIVPTALGDGPVDEHTPRRVINTRALENHMFIAYSNLALDAKDPNNPHAMSFCGQSAIVGPDGQDLERFDKDSRGLKVHDIDFAPYRAALLRNPYWHDRRPDLYGLIGTQAQR